MTSFSQNTMFVAVVLGFVSTVSLSAEPNRVPNTYEAAAVRKGIEQGVGSVALQGPRTVQVNSHDTWTLIYTAGKKDIEPGGGIRVGMRHVAQWSPPQALYPKGEGFLSAQASRGQKLAIDTDSRSRQFFRQYFPWQNMIEVLLPDHGLKSGETLRITFGDRKAGSPGIRVQPFDERRFVFKCYVDVRGEGSFYPLADSPAIEVVAAEPYRLKAVTPSNTLVGENTWCLVRAEDRYGNPAPDYRGTVSLSTSDATARLPQAHTFNEADRGVFRFEDLVLTKPDILIFTAQDDRWTAHSNPVRVTTEKPERLVLWGDLHGHTLFSDGRGTVEEYYEFADRVAGLDVCAVSDHAFEVLDEMWAYSKRVTNRANQPGRFVTFNAFEWSGNPNVGGDHNVYFLEDDPPLYRSGNYQDARNLQMDHGPAPKVSHVKGLFALLDERSDKQDVFTIPHYGGRRGNPMWHHPSMQRLIEIYSEHRRSEDWAGTFLAKGHRVGIMASGDDHYCNPGYGYLRPTGNWDTQEIGMALVGICSLERTREAVFRALYNRQTYATSGERILLDFRVDRHPMGSEFRTNTRPTISVEAFGTSTFARVEIKKNGQTAKTLLSTDRHVECQWSDPDFDAEQPCYYYVRVVQEDGEEAISSPVWVN